MRARIIGAAALALAAALSVGMAGSASAAQGLSAAQAIMSTTHGTTAHHTTTGAQHFEVYATNFEASYAPVYFTGVINTVGTGYKDFAEAQDQVYAPNAGSAAGGTLVIFHPGLTQTTGTTVTFDPATCITSITGSGPVHFIQGTGVFAGISGNGTVDLDIRVFQRKKADGSCDNDLPPIGYIEIAKGNLTVTVHS